MTKQNAPVSLAVRRESNSNTPFTAEELLTLGQKYAQVRRVGMSWREDAAQEFAIAGLEAVNSANASDNIRAFQIKAGKWAVANLWRGLHRNRLREESIQLERFYNFDSFCGIDPEIIVDQEASDPLSVMIADEEAAFMQRAILSLPILERDILCAVVYDGCTKKELSRKRKVSPAYIWEIYMSAIEKLKKIYRENFKDTAYLRDTSAELQRVPQNRQQCEPSGNNSAPCLPHDGQGMPDIRFDLSKAM